MVWNYYRNGRTDAICYHHLKNTGTHKRVPLAGGQNLEISGTRICYERNARIYVYDFVTKKEKAVSPKNGSARDCDISGKVVIWQEYRNGHNDIYGYNLTTRKETRLTTDTALRTAFGGPKVSGSHVVWSDSMGTAAVNTDLYSYDLVTRVEIRITTADERPGSPQYLRQPDRVASRAQRTRPPFTCTRSTSQPGSRRG